MPRYLSESDLEANEKEMIWKVRELLSELPTASRSKCLRFLYEQNPKYKKRVDNEGKDPHEGYIYIIRDPRFPEDRNIIFVGSSRRPWEAVQHHLEESTLPEVREYMAQMLSELGNEHVVIRSTEVVDYAEMRIDSYDDYPLPEGAVEIPWEVVSYNPNAFETGSEHRGGKRPGKDSFPTAPIHLIKSRRHYWTEHFRSQGHPILNKKMGRPKQED